MLHEQWLKNRTGKSWQKMEHTHTHTEALTMCALYNTHVCYHTQYTCKLRHTHIQYIRTLTLLKDRDPHTCTQRHTYTCRVLLLLPDKSLSKDQCLCTSGGAEGERNWEEWTHVVNLFQLQRQRLLTHSHFPSLVHLLLLPTTLFSFATLDCLSFFFSFLSVLLFLSLCLAPC